MYSNFGCYWRYVSSQAEQLVVQSAERYINRKCQCPVFHFRQIRAYCRSIAIFFVEPFILTALSALILGEKVGWRRWLAIAVGFIGALMVIQPNLARFGPVSLLPLGTATLFAFYLILNRVLAARDTSLVMQYSAGVGGVIALGVAMVVGSNLGVGDLTWTPPVSKLAVFLLLGIGVISTFGHLLVVTAFRHAPVSLLAPFQYFEIISAVAVGFVVFDEFPTPSKWLGIAIIIGSGLFILWREQRSKTKTQRGSAEC